MSGYHYAPWSDNQVASLNAFQQSGFMHPFTCGNSHSGKDRTLRATTQGWVCPNCDYTQNWAYTSMATGEWKRHYEALPDWYREALEATRSKSDPDGR